ncbi:MAG: hypothetical protein QM648_09285 [Solirubrobacterales bacterium]
MLKRLARIHPATVISCVALFVALSGASYAAVKLPKNSVGDKQLKKNAVTGKKVKDGSLTGSDIKLSSLGTVPNATHAGAADSAESAKTLSGGVSVKRVHVVQPYDTAETEIYNNGGLTLTAACSSSGQATLYAGTTVDHSLIHYNYGDGEYEYDNMNVGSTTDIYGGTGGDSLVGQIVYATAANTVTLNFASEVDSDILGTTGNVCAFTATAVKS